MEKCYKKLVKFCHKLDNLDKTNIIESEILIKSILKDKLFDIEFLSMKMKNKIMDEVKKTVYYKIGYGKCIIEIYSSKKISVKMLEKICKRIVLLKLLGKSNKNHFILYLIPSRFKKKYKNGDSLCGDNINSGATWINSGEIIIWRKEEMLKVLTHELIHSFKYDNGLYNHSFLSKKFGFIKNRYLLNETYTEILAEFINLALELDCVDYSVFNKMWLNEVDFSICQTIRVMNILGFNNFKDMISTEWKQKTNVFNYYVLRSAIMIYYQDFFKKFCSLNINPKKFELFAEKVFYSKKYRSIINKRECSKTNSLRMTCYG